MSSFVRNPGGRNPVIPVGAVDQGDGTSRYDPPGGGGIGWIFNNLTGFITRQCTDATAGSCVDFNARLLSGYVRFATSTALGGAPTGADAESPLGLWEPVQVQVVQTDPVAQAGTVDCFEETLLSSAAEVYYCAVPVGVELAWSGQSLLVLDPAQAFDVTEPVNPDRRRVCRYTPVRSCQPAVASTIWGAPGATASCSGTSPTPSRKMTQPGSPADLRRRRHVAGQPELPGHPRGRRQQLVCVPARRRVDLPEQQHVEAPALDLSCRAPCH